MFRVKLYIFALVIPLTLLITACSKSDTATAPDNSPVVNGDLPVIWANGKICLQPELTFGRALEDAAGFDARPPDAG